MLAGRRKAALRALSRRIAQQELSNIQPLLLLQMIGLSQIVDGAVAHPEAVAQALMADAQSRLRALREAAPHVDLSLAGAMAWIWFRDATDKELGAKEGQLQAVLQMCLGLVLRWISRRDHEPSSHSFCLPPRGTRLTRAPRLCWLLLFPLLSRPRSCLMA